MHLIPHDDNALARLAVELTDERMTRFQRLHSRLDVLENQHRFLEEIVRYALVHSPYYRNLAAQRSLSPGEGLALFGRLPLLTRALYAEHLEAIKTPARDLCYQDRTSGTSGIAIGVFRDSRSLFLESIRLGDCLKYYAGEAILLGPRRVAVLYVSHYPSSDEHVYQDPMLNEAAIVKIRCDGNLSKRAISGGYRLERGAYMLTGTPSSLLHLANSDELLAGLPAPAAVLPAGEVLGPVVRTRFEQVFCAPVFELYTFRECGTIAFQCNRSEGFHISSDWFLVEVVDADGRLVPDGDSGQLAVTDLTNLFVPLLRYTPGDFGSIRWSQCPCGMALPLLTGLSGRAPTYFVTSAGRLVDTAVFAKELERLPIVWYCATQRSNGSVAIEYSVAGQDAAEHLTVFCEFVRHTLGLAAPVVARQLTLPEAVQHGKHGGFRRLHGDGHE